MRSCLPVGLSVAAVLCAGLGWATCAGLFRRMLAKPALAKRVEANSLILFYGISAMLQNAAALVFTASPRADRWMDAVVTWGGVSVTLNRLISLGIAAGICIGVLAFLWLHLFGWGLRTVIERRKAAQVVGVNIERGQLATIRAGFAVAGIAGALVSMTGQITPFMGFPFTLATLRRDRGLTFVIVEHVIGAQMTLSDRILVLHHGPQIALGTPADIGRDAQVAEVCFGWPRCWRSGFCAPPMARFRCCSVSG